MADSPTIVNTNAHHNNLKSPPSAPSSSYLSSSSPPSSSSSSSLSCSSSAPVIDTAHQSTFEPPSSSSSSSSSLCSTHDTSEAQSHSISYDSPDLRPLSSIPHHNQQDLQILPSCSTSSALSSSLSSSASLAAPTPSVLPPPPVFDRSSSLSPSFDPLPSSTLCTSESLRLSSPSNTLASSSSSAACPLSIPPQRHLARTTLKAGLELSQRLVDRTKNTNFLTKFSIETTSKLANPAKNFLVNKWTAYGDPLLSKLDAKIDSVAFSLENAGLIQQPSSSAVAITASTCSTSDSVSSPPNTPPLHSHHAHSHGYHRRTSTSNNPDELSRSMELMALDSHSRSTYALYWERLKEKFVRTTWYSRVDDILMSNKVMRGIAARVGTFSRPAEVFYNTVTEEFMATESLDDFLAALHTKLGAAWDDRLTPLAKGFYTTAKAVSKLVGLGNFVGGALQLGKAKVNNAIDDLLATWDRVLGLTDGMIDNWLPEKEQVRLLPPASTHLHQHMHHRHRHHHHHHHHHNHGHHERHLSVPLDACSSVSEDNSSSAYSSNDSELDDETEQPDHASVFTMDMDFNSTSAQSHTSAMVTSHAHSHAHPPRGSISGRPLRARHAGDNGSASDSYSEDSGDTAGASTRGRRSPGKANLHSHGILDGFPITPLLADNDTNSSAQGSDGSSSNRNRKRHNESLYSSYDEDDVSESECADDMALVAVSGGSSSNRGVVPLAAKFTKRIRQRLPSIPTVRDARDGVVVWVEDLKSHLTATAWFNSVDEILMQNMFVRALANFMRPAEHFFNTALHLFQRRQVLALPPTNQEIKLETPANSSQENSSSASAVAASNEPASLSSGVAGDDTGLSVESIRARSSSTTSSSIMGLNLGVDSQGLIDDFVIHLRRALGASWDDRLVLPAMSFFQTAIKLRPRSSA